MKVLKRIGLFLILFFIYYFVSVAIFPTDDSNVLLIPDWYMGLGMIFTFGGTWLFPKLINRINHNVKVKSKIENNIKEIEEPTPIIPPSAPTLALPEKSASLDVDLAEPISAEFNHNIPANTENEFTESDDLLNSQQSSDIIFSVLPDDYDTLLDQAATIIFETNQASVSLLQRRLQLDYSRATRLIDQLEDLGVVSPFAGSTPRVVLMTKQQYLLMRQSTVVPKFPKEDPKLTEEPKLDIDELIRNEEQWRIQQYKSELDYIDHMEGHKFESWCADLLRRNGFTEVEITPGSGDQGVDILAKKDGLKYAVQCKCYSSDLSNKPIQEVYAGKTVYKCQVGAVMTNRYFTSGAKQVAESTGVLLWDRDKLIEMLK